MRKILLVGVALATMALPTTAMAGDGEMLERSIRAAGFHGDTVAAPRTSAEEIARWDGLFNAAHANSISFFPGGHQGAVDRMMWAAGFDGDTRPLRVNPPTETAKWQERFDASHKAPEAFFGSGRRRLD